MSLPPAAPQPEDETDPLDPRLASLDRGDERWLAQLLTHHRFTLAKWVLFGAAVIFLAVALLYYFEARPLASTACCEAPEASAGESILDATITILPPIVTLVLGYYFGRE